MHLCHPTKSLVSSLNASQRMSRRQVAEGAEGATGGGDLGWTPGAAKVLQTVERNGGGGELGWVPGRRDDRR
jgi:splicing factor U2AF subunit